MAYILPWLHKFHLLSRSVQSLSETCIYPLERESVWGKRYFWPFNQFFVQPRKQSFNGWDILMGVVRGVACNWEFRLLVPHKKFVGGFFFIGKLEAFRGESTQLSHG